jgi:hypothetical protein
VTANESEIGGTPGCNYSDVETETHTHKEGPQVRHWLMLPNQALFLSPTSVCGGPQT